MSLGPACCSPWGPTGSREEEAMAVTIQWALLGEEQRYLDLVPLVCLRWMGR